jgi:hypothetical protein
MTAGTCATCAHTKPAHDMRDDARPLPAHRICGVLLPPWVAAGAGRTVSAAATCDLHAEAPNDG